MFTARYGLNIHAQCAYCSVPNTIPAVCKVFSAQMYGSDIMFDISVLFITLHKDSLSVINCSLA